MIIQSFLRGILMGFAMAVPIGPLGILCMRRSIAYGGLAGFISGLGVASADAFYAIVAGFGLGFIQVFLLEHQCFLVLVGCIVLLILGISSFFALPVSRKDSIGSGGLFAFYISAFILTISSPITLLAFMAVIASLGLDMTLWSSAVAIAAGVFTGSIIWWIALSISMGLLHRHMNTKLICRIHMFSGIILIAFAIGLLAARYDCLLNLLQFR